MREADAADREAIYSIYSALAPRWAIVRAWYDGELASGEEWRAGEPQAARAGRHACCYPYLTSDMTSQEEVAG